MDAPPEPPRRRRPALAVVVLLLLGGMVLLAAWGVSLDRAVRSQFEGKRWAVPATVYARPLELYPGLALSPDALAEELAALEYREQPLAPRPGTWQRQGALYLVHTRPFAHWDGAEPARRLRLRLDSDTVSALADADTGSPAALARLDAARIGHIYPGHTEDRWLLQLAEVPPLLVAALMAVEDSEFFHHRGVSLRATLRAALANLRARRIVQGGSTLTQQLVKNFYLDDERSFRRKFREAAMALLLERRYSKGEILETYLNEVYLAQDQERAIHGFGLASQHLFGEPLETLAVEQLALLVAMVNGPSYYNPRRHPERALQRRDLVLQRMGEEGLLTPEAVAVARERPLGVLPAAERRRRGYPAFLELVQRDLARDYAREDLQSEGLRIFTTLAPAIQGAVEDAIATRLAGQPQALEAAAVFLDADSGEILALVGGRDPRFAGFNRALDARRPIGSLVKPAIYLAALAQPGRYSLASLLEDAPLSLALPGGQLWEPRNFDREFRGEVLTIDALAQSLNLPTIRLGLEVGLPEVAALAGRLGLPEPAPLVPSWLIGTGEHPPMEVAQFYQTLAAGGFRTPLRAVRAVTRQDGERLSRYPLATETLVDGRATWLVQAALVEAMRSGTGRSATLLPGQVLAGKTGTTGDTRDSWFAGFGEDLLGVVWLGRDDNGPTRLTGATGALPIWTEVMRRAQARSLERAPPEGVVDVWIEPATGRYSAEGCPGARRLPFHADALPDEWSECGRRAQRPAGRGLADWLRELLGQ
jgi:penicillin-binding protein 1B